MAAALPVLKAVASVVSVVSSVKSLTSKPKAAPAAPAPKAAPAAPKMAEKKTAPVADDREKMRAQQKKVARQYAGAGRAGTILSEGSKLG